MFLSVQSPVHRQCELISNLDDIVDRDSLIDGGLSDNLTQQCFVDLGFALQRMKLKLLIVPL